MGSEKINEPVSVSLLSDYRTHRIVPMRFLWKGRDFRIERVGLHHVFTEGNVLYHVFSVVSGTTYFRLVLNARTLFWRLEEVGPYD